MCGADSARSSFGLCFRAAAPVLGRWAAVRGVDGEAGGKETWQTLSCGMRDEVHWFHLNLM